MNRPLLEAELEAVGIRLNQGFPNVSFKIKKAGGISFNATLKLTMIDQKMVHNILHDYSKQSEKSIKRDRNWWGFFLFIEIFNADIVIREDISVDQFIDVILGNRRYINCIYVSEKAKLQSGGRWLTDKYSVTTKLIKSV